MDLQSVRAKLEKKFAGFFIKLIWRKNNDKMSNQFVEQMQPEEAAKYEKYWRQDYEDVYKGSPNTRGRKYTTPGTRSITDQKLSSTGELYERQTIYDQYGRKIGPVSPGLHPETPES